VIHRKSASSLKTCSVEEGRFFDEEFFRLARNESKVIVHDRDIARGTETVEAIIAAGGRTCFAAADLSNPADLRRQVEDIGDLDILVNNAGFSVFGATAALDIETF
jgi:NAD(P)-dependent dehydrogenase (short-subunit alcohol dehydrogenase family)